MLKIRLKDNKQSAVWLVEPKVSVGRSNENEFVVNDPSVAAHHVDIQVSHENLTLVNVSGGKTVTVNGKVVEQKAPLQADDILGIGNVELIVIDPKREQAAKSQATTAESEPGSGWALKANHTALANRVFPIKAETVVGRANDCDITLAAAHLSRRHAKLTINNNLLYVKDLGSSNGTYLNGKRIVGEERVRRGDELRFDTLSFGVIGPSQDMDKTTVRPVPTIKPPQSNKPAPARAGTNANKHASRAQQSPRPAAGHSAAANTPDEPSRSKGPLVWIIGIVLVIAIGAGIAFQQGLIS